MVLSITWHRLRRLSFKSVSRGAQGTIPVTKNSQLFYAGAEAQCDTIQGSFIITAGVGAIFQAQFNNNLSPVQCSVTHTNSDSKSDCEVVISWVHRLLMLMSGITSDMDPFELCMLSKFLAFTKLSAVLNQNLNYILTWETGADINMWNVAERQSVGAKMIMMRLELFLLLTMVISTATKPLKASGRNKLLLISFDGFRWDYDQDVETPHLDKLVEDGVKAKYITPPMLTMTGPSHFTTITGNTHLHSKWWLL